MDFSPATQTLIRFGPYELDVKAGILRKDGTRLRCQEQPLQVLAVLAGHAGELVTREELRRGVWPQDTFVDFDHALNTAIKKIRAVLNDDADAPRYIETVPRRGYRFIATLEQDVQPETTKPDHGGAISRRAVAIATVVIVLLVILGALWRLTPWRGDAATTPEFQRLTFNPTKLGAARFTPDSASVVYCAGGLSQPMTVYTQRLDASGPRKLGLYVAMLLAVSPQGQLAVLGQGAGPGVNGITRGTLAEVALEGGAPRELLSDVEFADWSRNGQLAVVRKIRQKSRLEFPVGNVLYETTGEISHPRFSPKGDAIAFLDHPVAMDDRGWVAMVDFNGHKKNLSKFWESSRGLAWNPRGDEVWFTATRSGMARGIYAVGLNGGERRVLNVAGGITLHDISSDGRVLLSRDNDRSDILFVEAGASSPRELSWKDFSVVTDISADGKRILFGEEGENSGLSYQVGVRPTDGSAPVILGTGVAQTLSPDGQWALSIMPAPDSQIILLPTGAGSPKTLERGSIEHYEHTKAKWFPDGRILFVGYEAGHGARCYVQSINGGKPQSVTEDGSVACFVSPAGQILALTEDSRALFYNSDSSRKPDKQLKFNPGELPVGWSADSNFIYVLETAQKPATITKFDIASSERIPWKKLILPADQSTGEMEHIGKMEAVVITPDGQSYAYTYIRHSSDLYMVQGLK